MPRFKALLWNSGDVMLSLYLKFIIVKTTPSREINYLILIKIQTELSGNFEKEKVDFLIFFGQITPLI